MILLPGGGYAGHAPHEAQPVAAGSAGSGSRPACSATRSRPPPGARDALLGEIRDRRAAGAGRDRPDRLRPAATWPAWPLSHPVRGTEAVQFAVLGYAITSMETETYRPSRLILLGEDASPQARRAGHWTPW